MQKLKPKVLDYAGLRQAIINLLGRRDYSRKELYDKYKVRVESLADLDSVLDDFAELGWQCDTRFCESYLNSRRYRYGPIRLKYELGNKGISEDQVEQALEQLDMDWYAQATDILQRKYADLDTQDHKQKGKAYRFLAQRGFNSEHIQQALAAYSLPKESSGLEF